MNRLTIVLAVLITAGLLVAGPNAHALQDDWAQWMGPGRDNVWRESGLLESFPDGGPSVVWRAPIAGGYAGPAVAGGRVFVTDYLTEDDVKVDNFRRGEFSGQERIWCLDQATGKKIWQREYPVKYSISYPAGPRCTPVIDDELVYCLGAEGHMFCLNADNGETVWSIELKKQYGTKSALWGYSAHPLIDGDNLITLAGGEGSHVVALNKRTGEEIWRSSSASETGYSPPTIIEAGGVRQLILARPGAVSAVNPTDGSEYWSVPYEATSGSIIMSPVRVGEYLYIGGYSKKSLLLKLNAETPAAEEVWRDKGRDAISPVNVQPIAVEDVIYGVDQDGSMVAIKIPDGQRLWKTSEPISKRPQGSGTAFIVRQADRFWLFNENGEMLIARMNPDGYEEIDRAKVIEPSNLAFGREVVWSMPAFAGKRVYIRNDDEIICVDLAGSQP